MSERCVFCAIVAGEAPAHIVHEDPHAVAFLDVNPIVDGHTLVVPRRHIVDLLDSDPSELAQLVPVVHEMAHRVRDRLGAEGVNVFQSSGRAAGQVVFHLHVHVVPRRTGDGMTVGRPPRTGHRESLDAVHNRLVGG